MKVLPVSKLVLGTAQLGMKYGVTNFSGLPSHAASLEILETAWKNGIHFFDTAPDYNSELIIGDFVRKNNLSDKVKICTKIPSIPPEQDWQIFIENTISSSLSILGCETIEVLFFHNPSDSKLVLKNPLFFQELMDKFQILNLGVSVYNPKEIEILQASEIELSFQFPYNIVDTRFENIQIKGGNRFARSIFLQGLLISSKSIIKSNPKLSSFQKKYHNLLSELKLDGLRVAISKVSYSNKIDYFLVGVEKLEQLIELVNLNLYDMSKLNLLDDVSESDIEIIDPRLWN